MKKIKKNAKNCAVPDVKSDKKEQNLRKIHVNFYNIQIKKAAQTAILFRGAGRGT